MTEWTADKAAKFLREAASYFERRPTDGEDSAFWANYANAKNCVEIADMIEDKERIVGSLQTGLKEIIDLHPDPRQRANMIANATLQKVTVAYRKGNSTAVLIG